jgi:spore coat protein U-like protein
LLNKNHLNFTLKFSASFSLKFSSLFSSSSSSSLSSSLFLLTSLFSGSLSSFCLLRILSFGTVGTAKTLSNVTSDVSVENGFGPNRGYKLKKKSLKIFNIEKSLAY